MHLVNIFQTLSPRTNPYARASFLPRFSLCWKKVSRRRERAFFPREKFFSTIIAHPFIILRSFSFPRTSFLRLLSTDTHNYAFRMHTGIEALNTRFNTFVTAIRSARAMPLNRAEKCVHTTRE